MVWFGWWIGREEMVDLEQQVVSTDRKMGEKNVRQ